MSGGLMIRIIMRYHDGAASAACVKLPRPRAVKLTIEATQPNPTHAILRARCPGHPMLHTHPPGTLEDPTLPHPHEAPPQGPQMQAGRADGAT